MIALSVNINKIATLRNARGGQIPDLFKAAQEIERFGAQGITVHPRPDERHIRYSDVPVLKSIIRGEFNIEGNPMHPPFMDLVLSVLPHQVTLVPDQEQQLTSNHGWDLASHHAFLKSCIQQLKSAGIRSSLFIDPKPELVEQALYIGTDRLELYTESYAQAYANNPRLALEPYVKTALLAQSKGIEINAGHDLNLNNIAYLAEQLPGLKEVSVGHALIADALYFGLQNTVGLYRRALGQFKG